MAFSFSDFPTGKILCPEPVPNEHQTSLVFEGGSFGGCYDTRGTDEYASQVQQEFSAVIQSGAIKNIRGYASATPQLNACDVNAGIGYYSVKYGFYARKTYSNPDISVRPVGCIFVWFANDTLKAIIDDGILCPTTLSKSFAYHEISSVKEFTIQQGERICMEVFWQVTNSGDYEDTVEIISRHGSAAFNSKLGLGISAPINQGIMQHTKTRGDL